MQTFLPYSSFEKSVQVLDWRRLNKQRVEAKQILSTLRFGSRWSNHPAVRMWQGYEGALIVYMNTCIWEWIRRGYGNNMEFMFCSAVVLPSWFGSLEFHAAHRSNLLRKNPGWYSQFGWSEPDNLSYVWP